MSPRLHVLQMLVGLKELGFGVMPDDVYTDPDMAVRLLWSNGERNAELVFPLSELEVPYVYHSDGREFGVEESPDAQCVLKHLNWVLHGTANMEGMN